MRLLLDHNAIIDTVGGDDNDTPLHDAVSNDRIEVVQLLLERGAQVTIRFVNFIITQCSPKLKVENCC